MGPPQKNHGDTTDRGSTMSHQGSTMEAPWGHYGITMDPPRKEHGSTKEAPWRHHGSTMGIHVGTMEAS